MTPAVNQVEYAFSLLRKLEYDSHDNFRLHPYLAQNELRDYCTRKGIALTAYTPSGKPIFLINNLASKYTDSSKSRIFPRPRPPTDRIPGREIQSHTHASHIRVAPFPEYYHPPHEQKFREAEGEYHGASYQPFESFFSFFNRTYYSRSLRWQRRIWARSGDWIAGSGFVSTPTRSLDKCLGGRSNSLDGKLTHPRPSRQYQRTVWDIYQINLPRIGNVK